MEFDDGIGGDRSGLDDAVAAALSYLDSVDPATAADAQIGWDGLRAASPTAGPTQNSVQTFLWVHLRVVAEDAGRAQDIANALADLLERLGHARYAGIARSTRTHELLAAAPDALWQQRYDEALADSGIGPTDTDLITWQDVPEGAERAIADLIGETLEVATVAGEFAPTRLNAPPLGTKTLSTRRRGVVDAVLRTERAGGVLLEQLVDHRIGLWTQYSPPRVELYRGLSDELHAASEPAYGCVRRLEGLLALVGDGITLTERGYLPDALVERAVATLWTPREWPFPSGAEPDTVPVLTVRRLLLRLGLVRKYHGRLLPTARSRGVSADRLWNILVARLVGTDYHPETIAADVVLAEVIRGKRPHDTTELCSALLVAEGWTHLEAPPRDHQVEPLAESVLSELTALGAFSYSDGRRGLTSDTPSPDGIRLAAAVLRHRLLHTRLPAL
ncbi:hypothetical protein QMK17_02160 [Rhodococcus sp. G-MC3]|uniref:hypothetical protein n=1 Tax=Rhodococcus sp. G-MC3 TaxID=3046209 RepID=UPI0024B96331|nr:hypothetical protein [Rhodococcus sp. G-MC3]MDJ0392136.1 hypothetical protein [Rhodococcus sp. G-MC3]